MLLCPVWGHNLLAVHLLCGLQPALQVLFFSVFLWLQMRNRRFPGGGGQTEARTDPQLMKEKSQSWRIKRHADDKANEITRTEKQALSIGDGQHTHTLFNLSAWVCNHALNGCCGFRACGTGSVIVQSFLQTAHYRLRNDMFTFAPRFLLHVLMVVDQRATLLHLCVCTDGLFLQPVSYRLVAAFD